MSQIENEPDYPRYSTPRVMIDVDWKVGTNAWQAASNEAQVVAGISYYSYQLPHLAEYQEEVHNLLEFTNTQSDVTSYGFRDATGQTHQILNVLTVGNQSLSFQGVGDEGSWAAIVGIEI